jgi:hypothetical protein
VKLTIDSDEPLEQALRVLGALYGVTLAVSNDGQDAPTVGQAMPSGDEEGVGVEGGVRKPATKKKTARKTPSKARKSRAAASATDTEAAKPEGTAPRSAGSPANAEIRAWARENGMTVSDRGRVPASVITAYRNAHGS